MTPNTLPITQNGSQMWGLATDLWCVTMHV